MRLMDACAFSFFGTCQGDVQFYPDNAWMRVGLFHASKERVVAVQLDTGLNHWPAQFGAHMAARMSDGTLVAVWFDGGSDSNGNLVYRSSSDGGVTWAAKATLCPLNENAGSFQAHFDFAQVGDTLYGACIRYVSGVQMTPFKLAYSGGIFTATVGGNTSISTYSSAGGNPTQGGTQLTVAHDADNNLLHVGVQLPGGLSLFAITESTLATAYSKSGGPATTNFNQPIIYIRGTVWTMYDTSVASVSASASAYGAWSGATALPGAVIPTHGCSAIIDSTQNPTQPCFAASDNNGNLQVYTYNGTTWTRTQVDGSGADYGASLWCTGTEIWVVYLGSTGLLLRKLQVGVWSASTLIDAAGDRGGWPTITAPANGTSLLTYFTGVGPFAVWAQTYAFATFPMSATFASAARLTAIFSRSLSVVAPFSTTDSTATLTLTGGASVTGVSVTVTFPDGSTSTYTLGSGVVSVDATHYKLTYITKMPGQHVELWTFTTTGGAQTQLKNVVGAEY